MNRQILFKTARYSGLQPAFPDYRNEQRISGSGPIIAYLSGICGSSSIIGGTSIHFITTPLFRPHPRRKATEPSAKPTTLLLLALRRFAIFSKNNQSDAFDCGRTINIIAIWLSRRVDENEFRFSKTLSCILFDLYNSVIITTNLPAAFGDALNSRRWTHKAAR